MDAIKYALKKLKPNSQEKPIIETYLKHEQNHLAVAALLKNHNQEALALEVLSQGCKKRPRHLPTRVAYTQELFQLGMIQEAWHILGTSPVEYHSNPRALRLLLYCAVLLHKQSALPTLAQHLAAQSGHTKLSMEVCSSLEEYGLQAAWDHLTKELKRQGIQCVAFKKPALQAADTPQAKPSHLVSKAINDRDIDRYQVIHLEVPNDFSFSRDVAPLKPGPSLTAANVYQNRGHYQKALDVFRQLAKQSPGNQYIREQIVNLIPLVQEQERQGDGFPRYQPKPLIEAPKQPNPTPLDAKIAQYEWLLEKVMHDQKKPYKTNPL